MLLLRRVLCASVLSLLALHYALYVGQLDLNSRMPSHVCEREKRGLEGLAENSGMGEGSLVIVDCRERIVVS